MSMIRRYEVWLEFLEDMGAENLENPHITIEDDSGLNIHGVAGWAMDELESIGMLNSDGMLNGEQVIIIHDVSAETWVRVTMKRGGWMLDSSEPTSVSILMGEY